jgi:hypothetical protein
MGCRELHAPEGRAGAPHALLAPDALKLVHKHAARLGRVLGLCMSAHQAPYMPACMHSRDPRFLARRGLTSCQGIAQGPTLPMG